jgi:uncharacterized protein involved in exopolysaccharide biosynthesis
MSSKLEQQNTTELAKLSPANSGGSNGDGRISLELNRTEFVVTTLRLLGKHGRFIARVTAVGAALSVIVALLLPPTYTATSRLLPPDPNGSPTSAMLGMLAGNLGGAAGLLANSGIALTSSSTAFIAILRSDTVLDRLIERNQLQAVYRTRSRETARTMLADRTIIAQDRKTGVISVTVADRIPERAADLANAYIAELNRLTAELNIGAAHRERVFIEGRLKEVKQELEHALGRRRGRCLRTARSLRRTERRA